MANELVSLNRDFKHFSPSGLAMTGAWCCFDEFNRINIEVLSVIAQQLLSLFGAKADIEGYNGSADVMFEGGTFLYSLLLYMP